MSDMLAMGGYGAYVWSSFALTVIVVVVCAVQAVRRHAKTFDDLKTRIRAMEAE